MSDKEKLMEDDKKYICKKLDEAAKLYARAQAIILDLKRKYNGRRVPLGS